MRLIHKGDKSVATWGLTASCLSCGAVFEISRDDILLDHLQVTCEQRRERDSDMGAGPWISEGALRETSRRIKNRYQMCRDACYYLECPTCFGFVYLEYMSLPEHVRTYVEAIREPTRKSDWLTRENP